MVADITLPDMPGSDMAVQMADRNPNIRILLCSGYPFAVDSLPNTSAIGSPLCRSRSCRICSQKPWNDC